MKKILFKISSALAFLIGWLLSAVLSFLISFIMMGGIMSICCSIWSFIRPLPPCITNKYGLVLTLASIPEALIVFIYMIVNNRKTKIKK